MLPAPSDGPLSASSGFLLGGMEEKESGWRGVKISTIPWITQNIIMLEKHLSVFKFS